ncbi:hypothetical protein OKE68_11095, partial [Riemerella anatipestifer]|nr:hypothetical protein [Riemerella anatipestifer]MCW0491308.1 hypothetical protein [Riemerella anatipestifer]MCW0520604.1 hypothetical protein [Riemerella anatipestifer]MCW0524851.1 hypothetical protein [Riemerella anatipestifer]
LNIMKYLLALGLGVVSVFGFSQIQTAKRIDLGNKWTFGGYAGLGGALSGGGRATSLFVSPRVGYMVSPNFEVGMASNLTWTNASSFSNTMIGVGPFANYYFDRKFFVQGLYQHHFINLKNKISNEKYSTNEPALYLGGGYMQRLGSNAYMQIGGMYNVLYNKDKSYFSNAFVPNVGIVFGL